MAWVQCPPLPLCAAPPLSLGAQRALLSGEGQQLGAERWEGAAGGGGAQPGEASGQEQERGYSPQGAGREAPLRPGSQGTPNTQDRRLPGVTVHSSSRCRASCHPARPDGSKPHPGPQSMRPVWPGAQRVCAAGLRGG